MRFFTGLHQPSDAQHFDAAFISVNRLRDRKRPFVVGDWIMDSGAFTEISTHGRYRHDVSEYAAQIRRWSTNGNLLAAVAQDWMCETFILVKTGLTVQQHQAMACVFGAGGNRSKRSPYTCRSCDLAVLVAQV